MGRGRHHWSGCNCDWCVNPGSRRRLRGAVKSPFDPERPSPGAIEGENKTYPFSCPMCRQRIFFFRHANGGCAFFDELGWPWKPHACFAVGSSRLTGPSLAGEHQSTQVGQANSAHLASRGYKVRVLAVEEIEDGRSLLIVSLVDHGNTLTLMAMSLPDRHMEMRLVPGDKAGIASLEAGPSSVVVFGPVFECWAAETWQNRTGTSESLAALGNDLGVHRFTSYGGQPVVRFLTPQWREAIALTAQDSHRSATELISHLRRLVSRHGAEAYGQREAAELGRMLRECQQATDMGSSERLEEVLLQLQLRFVA